MQALRAIAVTSVVIVAGAAGCGSGPGPAPPSCPSDFPSCPSPEPQFAADVLPVFQSICQMCHAPGGVSEVIPFLTYDDVRGRITTIITDVRMCIMPPSYAPQLTADQRQALLGWIACGAKDD